MAQGVQHTAAKPRCMGPLPDIPTLGLFLASTIGLCLPLCVARPKVLKVNGVAKCTLF